MNNLIVKGVTMNLLYIEYVNKMLQVYGTKCKPLCQETKIPQTAFDILMFLFNNPKYNTARDIVKVRGIKAKLVSINVDKLVNEGYLERKDIKGDRRKTMLQITDKAKPIIKRGKEIQENFFKDLFANVDDESVKILYKVIENIQRNLDNIMKEGK